MLIHDAIAEYILTQGDTEIRGDDISKYLSQVTNQINGEMTSLDIQYNVSGWLNFHNFSLMFKNFMRLKYELLLIFNIFFSILYPVLEINRKDINSG